MGYHCQHQIEVMCDFMKHTLIKARIQRKSNWTSRANPNPSARSPSPNYEDYLKFILDTRIMIAPLLLVERVVKDSKYLLVIDGNNRLNAIKSFMKQPLTIFENLIPNDLPTDIKNSMKNTSYEQITSRNFSTLQKLHKEIHGNEDGFKKLVQSHSKENLKRLEDSYERCVEALERMRILDVKVTYVVFHTIDNNNICDLYQRINEPGMPLTRQEVLAASTAHIRHKDFSYKNNITKEVKLYYTEMQCEELELEKQQYPHDELTLFEVIVGLQRWLHKLFPCAIIMQKKLLGSFANIYEEIHGFEHQQSDTTISEFITEVHKASSILHNELKDVFHILRPSEGLMTSMLLALVQSPTTSPSLVRCILVYDRLYRWAQKADINVHDLPKTPLRWKNERTQRLNHALFRRSCITDIDTGLLQIPSSNEILEITSRILVSARKAKGIQGIHKLLLSIWISRHCTVIGYNEGGNWLQIDKSSDCNRLGNWYFKPKHLSIHNDLPQDMVPIVSEINPTSFNNLCNTREEQMLNALVQTCCVTKCTQE